MTTAQISGQSAAAEAAAAAAAAAADAAAAEARAEAALAEGDLEKYAEWLGRAKYFAGEAEQDAKDAEKDSTGSPTDKDAVAEAEAEAAAAEEAVNVAEMASQVAKDPSTLSEYAAALIDYAYRKAEAGLAEIAFDDDELSLLGKQAANEQQQIDNAKETIAQEEAAIEDMYIAAAAAAASVIFAWMAPILFAAATAASIALAIDIAVLSQEEAAAANAKQKIVDLMQQVAGDEAAVAGSLSGDGSSMATTLDALLKFVNDLINAISSGNVDAASISKDVSAFTKIAANLIVMLKAEAAEDRDDRIIALYGPGDPRSQAALEDLVQQSETELGAFTSMFSDIINLIADYDIDSATASTDKDIHDRWYDQAFGIGNATGAKDDGIKQNAKAMIAAMSAILTSLSSQEGTLSPQFQELTNSFDIIMKKIRELLNNPHPSMGAMKEVLTLFAYAMTLLSAVLQISSNTEADNNKLMADATVAQQKVQAQEALLQQKQIESDMAYARSMKILMSFAAAAAAVAMAAVTIYSAGSAAGVAVAVMTTMFAAVAVIDLTLTLASKQGLMEMATEKLGNAMHSQVGSDVVIAGIELLLTAGAGAVAKIGVTAAEQSVKVLIQEIIESVTERAMAVLAAEGTIRAVLDATGKGLDEVNTALKDTIKASIEASIQQLFKQIGQRTFSLLASRITGSFTKDLTAAAEQAAKEAVENAIEEMTTSGTIPERSALEQIAQEAATRAIANVAKITEEAAEKLAKTSVDQAAESSTRLGKMLDTLKKAMNAVKTPAQAAGLVIYALSSTNWMVDIATLIEKLRHNEDQNFEEIKAILSAVQQLLQMVAMLGAGSSALALLKESSAVGMLMKISSVTQAAGTAGSVIGSAGQADALFSQSEVTEELAKTQALLEILQSLSKEIHEAGEAQQKHNMRDIEESLKSTSSLSQGLFNDFDMVSRVLMSNAV